MPGWKSDKNYDKAYMKSRCRSSDYGENVQSFKQIGIKFMRSCAHEVPTVYILRVKNDYVHNVEKSEVKKMTK